MTSIDPKIWKVCAGTSVQIPTVGSTVYYFPQGHAEQSYSPPEFSSLTWFKPFIFCHIVSVNLLSNPETDEVFANIVLEPCDRYDSGTGGFYNEDDDILEYNDVEKIVSFAKILTPSDANNGGGFSVPRSCADSVFPTLDIVNEETPVQTITARDVQGVAWEFRHIYRGTPRRHLLTTGWSKFVNKKSLVAGDSVVFMKNSKGEIFTGIRRAGRSMRDLDWGRWNYQYAQSGVKLEEDSGFSRNCKGRVSPESVVEAVKLAVSGRAFEIVYYPNVESSDFVVKSERVENSLITHWNPGMRFKMAVETDDSSRTAWFQGSVSSAGLVDNGTADASPWRMLQVMWDEPEVLQNIKRVSPWEVEVLELPPSVATPFLSSKKLKLSHNPEFLTGGEQSPTFFPMKGLANSLMEHMDPSFFYSNSFPAGMQGARHDSNGVLNPADVPDLYNFLVNSTHQMPHYDDLKNNIMLQASTDFISTERSTVSTDLNISNLTTNSVEKAGTISFQLFGKTICANKHVDAKVGDGESTEDDGTKEYGGTEGLFNVPELSLSSSYTKLNTTIEGHCQNVPSLQAYTL